MLLASRQILDCISDSCCSGSIDPAKRKKREASNDDVFNVATSDSNEVKEYKGAEGLRVIKSLIAKENQVEVVKESDGNVARA